MVVRRVWSAGSGTPVVTIPKDTRDAYDIRVGDLVDIEIKRVKRGVRKQQDEGEKEYKKLK